MARLKIFVLGGLRVEADARTRIPLTRKKGQALMGLLALRPGVGYPREALTALLWPESSDEEARHSLRQELHELRRALEPTRTRALVIDGERIALDPDAIEVDALVFERLAAEGSADALKRAAALYQGDLMLGVGVRESEFEDHLRGERERLRVRAVSVFTRLLEQQAQRNQVESATETALRLLALDPTQESVHRSLMKLYAGSGRRATALRQYQECVEVLQRELDVEPEAATRQLYREILASKDVARAADAGPRAAPPPSDRFSVDPPLAGRQTELAAARDVLDAVCGRRGHVLAIIGEAGVGKTRLVAEVTALGVARDARSISGRAYETAQVLALGPWVDALRAGLAADPGALTGLEPVWRAELARVLPEVEARPPRRAAPADAARIFEAVDRLIVRLSARQPLILALEDVHWADELTIRLVAHVARRIDTRPVLLIVTVRDEHLADAPLLDVALQEMRGHGRLLSVTLLPLSREDTVALTRSLARAERNQARLARLDERVWKISAGNPLLVVETVRALRDTPAAADSTVLPTRVREILAARVERLSEPARRLVGIASVVGRECDFRLLQHCAGLSDRDAAEVVEELVRRRVFHGVGEGLDFTHDRIRQVAGAALLPAQRQAMHRAIAASMEAVYAGDLDRHCAELAAHCRDGELWDKAVTYLTEAGMRAAERSAHREAAAAFEQALAALERLPESRRTLEQGVDVRLALHTSWYAVVELKRGHQALCDAEVPARKLGDVRRSALLASQTGQSLWVRGQSREALPLFEHAATVAKSLDDFPLLTSAALYIGAARFALGDLAAAEDGFRRVIAALGQAAGEKLGLHGLPLVFAEAGYTALLAEQGRFEEARQHGAASVRVAEALDHTYTLVFALRTQAHACTVEGRLAEAITILERGQTLCQETSGLALAPNIMASLGYAYSLNGRAAEGVRLLEESLRILEGYGQRVWYVVHVNQLAEACWLARDHGRAGEYARQAVSVARERGERGFEAAALRILAAVTASAPAPDFDAAQDAYASALALAEPRGLQPLMAHCHAGLATIHARLGQAATAEAHRATAARICRSIGLPEPAPS